MKRITRKRVAVILLIMALIVTQIPPFEAKADMSDFVVEGTTLIKYEGTEATVTIPNYIETIGREAFENNGSLVSVQMPNSVTTIETGAFARCKNLCSVFIPASVSDIAPSSFAGCERLASITIDSNNDSYKCVDGTLLNYKGTRLVQVLAGRVGNVEKSYTIPATVEKIDRYAFWGCDNIEKVQLNNYMTKIPAYAFSNMENLTTVSIPNNVIEIEMKAFEDCVSLSDVYIAPSVVKIHDTAFDGCRKLNIMSEPGSVADSFFQSFVIENVTQAEMEDDETGFYVTEDEEEETTEEIQTTTRVEADYSSANVDYVASSSYTEPEEEDNLLGRTKIVDGRAVVFVDNSKVQVYDKDSPAPVVQETGTTTSESQSSVDSASEETHLLEESSALGQEIADKKYIIMDGSIAERAFYKETELKDYQIPAGVTRIGDFSFARSGLTSIRIPSGVNSIGYGAFYHCENLSTIYIPTTVTEIEPAAFSNTAWLDAWKHGGDVGNFLVVGDGILLAYKGYQTNVEIPNNVKVIGPEVFKNHTEIQSVSLPDSVKRIDEEAFYGCSSLKTVSGGSYVEEIKDRAFYGCSIQTVRIPENVKSIGLLAYGDMSQTDSVVFMSDEIPKLSYEKTATRLSNKEYRKSPFEGLQVFVVPCSAKEFENTVLMDGEMGFDGIVCSVIKEPTLQAKGEVSVRKVSMDAQGNVAQVPNSVWIYGKEYYVTNVETDAIPSKYEETTSLTSSGEEDSDAESSGQLENTDSSATAASDSGLESQKANSENLDSKAQVSDSAAESVSDNAVAAKQGNLSVKVNKASWKEDYGIYADLTSDGASYELVISDSENDEVAQALAQEGIVADTLELVAFDLKLIETASQIPISRLGSEKVTVSLPISKGYKEQPVVAVCLDNDGQLEYISCIHHTEGEQEYVIFDVNHFSPYALLCGEKVPSEYQNAYYEKVAAKKAANYSSKYGKKDESPDTGDYVHPKWVLAAGLVLLAIYLGFKKTPVTVSDKK